MVFNEIKRWYGSKISVDELAVYKDEINYLKSKYQNYVDTEECYPIFLQMRVM